jgi:hypothetical protein
MKTQLINALLWAVLLVTASAAQAQQTVWRCGPGGTSYSNQPCAEGRAVGVDDRRNKPDVQAARDVAASDRKLAQSMRQERLQREAEQRAQGSRESGLGGFSAAKPVPPAKADQALRAAKGKAKSKAKTTAKTKRKPPQPAAAETSTKAARASRRARG